MLKKAEKRTCARLFVQNPCQNSMASFLGPFPILPPSFAEIHSLFFLGNPAESKAEPSDRGENMTSLAEEGSHSYGYSPNIL